MSAISDEMKRQINRFWEPETVMIKTGINLDRFGEMVCGVRRMPMATDEQYRAKCLSVLRGTATAALTAQDYADQRKLLETTRDSLRKAGYSSTADEYDEHISDLDRQWISQGGTVNGASGGTLTGTGAMLLPLSPGTVKSFTVKYSGGNWTTDPSDPAVDPVLFTPSHKSPCAFCGTATASKHDKHQWSLCESSACQQAATAQAERMYAGLVDCEETRADALRWVERGKGKRK